MRSVREVVYQKASPENAHELPHWSQTVLVRQVRPKFQPEQQHEDASKEVCSHRGDQDRKEN